MKLADFNRLKKFMALATSDNDHEALAALRHANELLRAEGVDWERVLTRMVQIEVAVEAAEPEEANAAGSRTQRREAASDSADAIDEAFRVLLGAKAEDSPSGRSYRSFVLDVERQWKAKGHLSPRQRQAILEGAARALEKRA